MRKWDKLPRNIQFLRSRLIRTARIGWTTERVMGLAASLRISIFELAAMAGMFRGVEAAALRNTWPDCVCLHFANFEDEYERMNGVTPCLVTKRKLCRVV